MNTRTYRQFCGVARALDLVGERWALLVVRELVLGPKRFTDLAHGLPGIGTNILSARLKQLEQGGVVRRRTLPPPAASVVYELTEYGRELEPTLLALGRWGAQSLAQREPEQAFRSEWLAVALRAFFDSDSAGAADVTASIELRLSDGVFHARIEQGALAVVPGPAEKPDLVVEATNDELLAFLAGLGPADGVQAEGDTALLARLHELFRFRVAA